jgi:hypothetical protein
MAVECKPRENFVESFFDQKIEPYCTFRGAVTNYKCPLMRVFSMQCVGDDYTSSNEGNWCFGRIDDICKVLGLESLTLSTELQRASLAVLLAPVYAPFYEYMLSDAEIAEHAFTRQRNTRYASSVYWYSLHRFLCNEENGKDLHITTTNAFGILTKKVELYVTLHKASPRCFTQYWADGENIFFDKFNSFAEKRAFDVTDPRYNRKWLEQKESMYVDCGY